MRKRIQSTDLAIAMAYANNPAMAAQYVKINNWTYLSVDNSLFGNGFCVCLMCNDYIGGGDEFFPLKRDAVSFACRVSDILRIPVINGDKLIYSPIVEISHND